MNFFAKTIIFAILLAVLIFLFYYFAGFVFSPASLTRQNKVCFGQNCFLVEVAETSVERENGLMDREDLAKNRGMLFIFDENGIYSFWMKNTLIPLDIIWINDDKIVFIEKNVQPCKGKEICQPITGLDANYVLEINAGISDEVGLKIGSAVNIY